MKINKNKSFVLLPKTYIININNTYYYYYENPSKIMIGWNNILVDQIKFDPSFYTFDISTQYKEEEIKNNIFSPAYRLTYD